MRLRIGLTPWLDDGSGSAWLHGLQAERAESLGFHSYWLPESHFTAEGAIPAPLLPLAAAAARTRRLRLGTTSYLLPVRHAIQVAEEVAVLDRLSEGRVILGVGRGFRPALFSVFEVPPERKRDLFQSSLTAMQRAWRGEPIAFGPDAADGSRTPVYLSPLPVQKPHPPIWVAAFGPKAVTQAGALGLPYLASPIEPMQSLIDNYARHRDATPAACRAQELEVPVMRTVFLSRDASAVSRVREGLARQISALSRAAAPSLRKAAGADVESVALIGEPKAVAERIRAYRECIGMTLLIARTRVPDASPPEIEGSLELLAELAVDGVF